MRFLLDLWRLALKELASLRHDPVMLGLIVYALSVAVVTVATGVKLEVVGAQVAVVDADRSMLSRRIVDALRPPWFKPPIVVDTGEAARGLDLGRWGFVVEFPPDFEKDAVAGRAPSIALTVDATAMVQAGNGSILVQNIVAEEVATWAHSAGIEASLPIEVVPRVRFNPNIEGRWFNAIMQLVNSITILSIILVGAAVIREREHGTIEHLLVMPIGAVEIALAKVVANGAVILVATLASMEIVVRWWLGVPIAGSRLLFAFGTVIYLFSTTSLGILIATVASSMPQFGLMAIPVFTTMLLLSGNMTPLESMPAVLQWGMHASPSVWYVQFSQALLYRGAGLDIVWPQLAVMAVLGVFFLGWASARFKTMLSRMG
jgi:ABC-2 type transport system permease protein